MVYYVVWQIQLNKCLKLGVDMSCVVPENDQDKGSEGFARSPYLKAAQVQLRNP